MSNIKQQILEPITAISRLVLLSFYPIGTKISIRDHKIVICKKIDEGFYLNKSFVQGIDRFMNGDSRKDIYILNQVIFNFIEWYVMDYKIRDKEIYDKLLSLIKYLVIGLRRLQITYKDDNVVLTIQYFINTLLSIINDTYDESMLYLFTNNSLDLDDDLMKYSTIFDKNKLKTFWTSIEINSLCTQFDKCFIMNEELLNDEIKSGNISDLIISDSKFKKLKLSGIELPIIRNKKNAIVKGTLVGINSILDTMDKNFTSIIQKSVKG
jgi:hypothetical protein